MMTRSPENTFLVPSIIIIPTDICQILDLFYFIANPDIFSPRKYGRQD